MQNSSTLNEKQNIFFKTMSKRKLNFIKYFKYTLKFKTLNPKTNENLNHMIIILV